MASLHLATEIFKLIYPVGSIYISDNTTNPSSLFGGTWSQITGGFLYGGSSYSTGNTGTTTNTGKASGNTGSHTLTVSEIPSHSHDHRFWARNGSAANVGNVYGLTYGTDGVEVTGSSSSELRAYNKSTGGGSGHTHSLNSHQHTIPYISTCIWRRTA